MSNEKKVLIVDDEQDAHDIVEAMLSEIGIHNTISATDGNSGLMKAKKIHPDLIIMDVEMPGKNGFEVFAALKKDDSVKDIPVIMLTGVKEKTGIGFSGNDMKEYYGQEPAAYIEKPVDAAQLQKTVLKLLG